MNTPNSEHINNAKDIKKFIANNLKKQGATADEYAEWLEKSKNSNPGANPRNPWILAEKLKEREI